MHLRLPAKFLRLNPRQMVRHEDPVHIAIKNYLEWSLPDEWIVHHSKNEGMSKAENGRAKAKGMKRGYPDLIIHGVKDVGLLVPRVVPFSWLIEVKPDDPKYQPSPDQRKLHAKFRYLGFPVAVARSIEEARELVIEWEIPSTDYLVVRARERASQEQD